MACTFHRLGDFTLEFQRSSGQTAWQYLALVINKLQQEVGVLVVNVLDAVLFEAAILFPVILHLGSSHVLNLFVCHYCATSSALGTSAFLLNAPLRFFSL